MIPLVIAQIGLTCLIIISKLFFTAVPYIASSDARARARVCVCVCVGGGGGGGGNEGEGSTFV